jgi:hypothetical protein
MVSSFLIETSIHVSKRVAREFNEAYPEGFSPKNIQDIVPTYYDSGYWEAGIKSLNDFLAGKYGKEGPLCDQVRSNNWSFTADGRLFDNCEKFHGAISMLHYFIDTFFAPRNVLLDGTIVGVNTEYALVYVYHVKDNVITLDEEATREYILKYERLRKKQQDIYDYDATDILTKMMCLEFQISCPYL